MIVISGGWGRIRTWVNKRIRIPDKNTFVGIDAGKVATGVNNNFMGYQAGYSNTNGYDNTFVGCLAGYSNITGDRNNFMGCKAGYNNIGNFNNFMGYQAGYNNVGGYGNNFMGYHAGYNNVGGYANNFMGQAAGYNNIDGYGNNFLGTYAGYYETGNYKFFIDSFTRDNEADGRTKALVYGIFAAAIADQLLRINGILELTSIKSGATQVAAGAAVNEVWKTASHATLPDNVLMIGV